MRLPPLFLALALISTHFAPAAEELPPIVKEGTPLIAADAKWELSAPPDVSQLSIRSLPEVSPGPVLHSQTVQRLNQAWRTMASVRFPAELRKGDVLLLTMRARMLESKEENGRGFLRANLQISGPPYDKPFSVDFDAVQEWKRFSFPFVLDADVPENRGTVLLNTGYGLQTVQIADVQLYRFPAGFDMAKLPQLERTYGGREEGAPWRKAALERIEKLRRSDVRIAVLDAAGKPVPGAKVHLQQKRHLFGFGSALVAARLSNDGPDDRKYQQVVDEFFSRGVLENDLKKFALPLWDASEPHEIFRREYTDRALDWCAERGISMRGHYLAWGNLEDWSEKLAAEGKAEQIKTVILDHARKVVEFSRGRVAEWDAVNHPVPFNRVLPEVLGPEIYTELMHEFRRLTKEPLWFNEDLFEQNRAGAYYTVLEKLKRDGVSPHGAGMMCHFRPERLSSMDELKEQLDRLATLVPHVQATEYDLESDDDQLHADHLRDCLILYYSHPAATGFVMWGFWEAQHWRPAAALWRKDWTERPAVQVWRDWVKTRWWTDERLSSDVAGVAQSRPFHGLYEVTAELNGRRVQQKLTISPETREVKLLLPE
jgi:GH35 family endo-1,4-beta-xylanase